MDDIFQRAVAYAKARNLTFTKELGAGVHGIVRVAKDNVNFRRFAVKLHRYEDPYRREKRAYLRLRELELTAVRGFNIPQFLHCDDVHRAIEMTIVTRPFLLDFAATWLDEPPDFPQDEWQESLEKREQFGERWPEVQRVLAVLRSHGIFMFDISPTNIGFVDMGGHETG
ncbi:MAG: hypothetical protein Q7S40_00235 [Opitutaceae bacterium]|nr:hypothetical protein [Opitutaceae bacterium]